MCVAIPGRVEEILERTEFSVPAMVRFPHGPQRVDLVLVPDADVGDHIIAHSGYAVSLSADPQVSPLRGEVAGKGVESSN